MPKITTRQEKHLSFWFIAAAFFAVSFYLISKPTLIEWDEAVYVGVGKYLFSLGKAGLFEDFRPLVLPLFLGFLWKTGLQVLLFGRVLEVFFSAGLLFATYKLASEILDRTQGLLAAGLLLASPVYLFYSGRLYTEIPSTFFAMIAVYAFVKQRHVLAGVFAALGFLTKFPQGLMLVVFLASFLAQGISEKKLSTAIRRSLVLLTAFGVTVLPYFIFNYLMFHKEGGSVLSALLQPLINARFGESNAVYAQGNPVKNLLFYIIHPIKDQWFFIFAFCGIAVMFLKKDLRPIQNKALFFYAALFFIYFTFIPHKEARYSVMMLPVFAIFASYWLRGFVFRPKMVAIVVVLFILAYVFGKTIFADRAAGAPAQSLEVETRMAEEYYSYFKRHPAQGAILTFDPLPAAYTDDLYVPFYVTDAKEALPIYHKFMKKYEISAIMFSPADLLCGQEDASCLGSRRTLICEIMDNKVLLRNEYYGRPFYILKVNSEDEQNSGQK